MSYIDDVIRAGQHPRGWKGAEGAGRKNLTRPIEEEDNAKQSNFYFLTQAGYVAAIQLMWACGITTRALRITNSPTSEGWTAELAVGLRLVVPKTGIGTDASRPRVDHRSQLLLLQAVGRPG